MSWLMLHLQSEMPTSCTGSAIILRSLVRLLRELGQEVHLLYGAGGGIPHILPQIVLFPKILKHRMWSGNPSDIQ